MKLYKFIVALLIVTALILWCSAVFGQAGTCPSWAPNNVTTKNCYKAVQNFAEKATFQTTIVQKGSPTDSGLITTAGAATAITHDNGTMLVNNTKGVMGVLTSTGYRVAATTTGIQLQQGSTDSITQTFTGIGSADTTKFVATTSQYFFSPAIGSNSLSGVWNTTGNNIINPAINFLGTINEAPLILRTFNTFTGYIGPPDGDANIGFGVGSTRNQAGTDNSCFGELTGFTNNTGISYATAIGYNALTGCDTCLILGDSTNTKVGIGTAYPSAKLHVVGNLKFVTGTQANGKILTSDASGNADWQTPTGSTVATNYSTGQTAAIATLTQYTNGASDASYRIGGNITITAVVTDVLQLQVTYTDETNASRTQTFFPQGLTSANLATVGAFTFPTMDIRVKASSTITVKTVLTVSAGSITYNAGGTITNL